MAQILIEENFRRIDGRDMEALIEALDGLGLEAGPTQQQSSDRSERDRHGHWVLVLHWIGAGAERVDDEAFAAVLADAVREVFRQPRPAGLAPALERTEPSRIAVHGAAELHLRDIPLDGA